MRVKGVGMALIVAGAAVSAHSEVVQTNGAEVRLRSAPTLIMRLAPSHPGHKRDDRLPIRLVRTAPVRAVAGGVDTSPFVTALPGEMWRGRMYRFGSIGGRGLSGIAVRARSAGIGAQTSRHGVSGFLASQLRYGIKLGGSDLLTVDLNAASQRLGALAASGRGKAIKVGSLYLGSAFVHDRLTLSGGWYAVSESKLPTFDYAIARAAGMPAPGQGVRLGLDWRLGQPGTVEPARIGIEWRDADADRDRQVALFPRPGRERRMMLRFVTPF